MSKNDLPILPHDRPMTAAELHGFRIALGCLCSWGTQLAAHAIALPTPPVQERPITAQERLGRQIVFIAEALDLTIGKRGY